jgi:hypothetical protein
VPATLSNGTIETIAVYVHLGPEIPRHLLLNLERHAALFPNQEIVLISNENWAHKITSKVENLIVPSHMMESDLFKEMSRHLDFSFRKGFWQYTLQRLFVLEAVHSKYQNRSLLHIESDVVLMPNFPWKDFEKISHLAWLPVNHESDIASLVFSPNLRLTQELVRYLVEFATVNPDTNDMVALRNFAISNPDKHKYLPSTTDQTSKNGHQFKSTESLGKDQFGGVFDPLAFGMWNFGQDPKNFFGIRRRYFMDDSHHLDPSRVFLSYQNSELRDSNGTAIFNLHLHSKYLKLFSSDWENKLINGLKEAKLNKKKYSFSYKVFTSILRENGPKLMIWEMLANFPGIKKLERHPFGEFIKNKTKKMLRF